VNRETRRVTIGRADLFAPEVAQEGACVAGGNGRRPQPQRGEA
jgi:hypothetical protein